MPADLPPLDTVDLPIGDGAVMHLRPSEVAQVVRGLAATQPGATPASVVAALGAVDERDRAPLWELAMRHLGRGKPLAEAAGEIGMDAVRAQALITGLLAALASAS